MAAMDNEYVTKMDLTEFGEVLARSISESVTRSVTENVTKSVTENVTKSVTENVIVLITGKMVELFNEFQHNIIGHMEENFATKLELKEGLEQVRDQVKEDMHDVETRLLRGYEHHARATESHLTTLDGHTAANFISQVSLAERMAALEARMLDLETKKRPQ